MFYLHFGHVSFYHPRLLCFFLEHAGFVEPQYGANPQTASPLLADAQQLAAAPVDARVAYLPRNSAAREFPSVQGQLLAQAAARQLARAAVPGRPDRQRQSGVRAYARPTCERWPPRFSRSMVPSNATRSRTSRSTRRPPHDASLLPVSGCRRASAQHSPPIPRPDTPSSRRPAHRRNRIRLAAHMAGPAPVSRNRRPHHPGPDHRSPCAAAGTGALHLRQWISANEPAADDLATQRTQVTQLARRPLISIITPVFNPPAYALRSGHRIRAGADLSALATLPRRRRLRGPAALPPFSTTTRTTNASASPDLAQNLGISGNSNAALALAEGEFVALLDHDDTLAPNMLFEVATLLNRHPEADIVYFDEDKLSADGDGARPSVVQAGLFARPDVVHEPAHAWRVSPHAHRRSRRI